MITTAQLPEHFELTDTYVCFRPVLETTLEEGIDLVDEAIRYCRDNEIGCLLLDIRGLTGFASPSVTDRFWFASRWAETSRGRVIMSILAPAELCLPDKIGVTVAMNRGLLCDVFEDEVEAVTWLQAHAGEAAAKRPPLSGR